MLISVLISTFNMRELLRCSSAVLCSAVLCSLYIFLFSVIMYVECSNLWTTASSSSWSCHLLWEAVNICSYCLLRSKYYPLLKNRICHCIFTSLSSYKGSTTDSSKFCYFHTFSVHSTLSPWSWKTFQYYPRNKPAQSNMFSFEWTTG